ncbi:mitotic interactor and substrate of PLK1 [Rhynochetos jubatus]
MDRVTRHLVFQLPQTPPKPGDAPQAGWAEQRAGGEDDVFGPAPDGGQKVGNGYGWTRRSKSPSFFLDGGEDAWTPSPDRESKLEVVRSGSLYDLRVYRGERKPSRLYDEDEQEERRVPPPNISPEKAKELEDERREVIRSQVMRKSSTMAERWSSTDELSSINAGTGGGFAVRFETPSSGRAATPVDPENVDTEQINFSAARQQFLMLEKTNPGSFFSPGQQALSPKPESAAKASRQEWLGAEPAASGRGNASASSRSGRDAAVHQGYGVSYKAPAEEIYAPKRADTERSHPAGKTSSLARASSREDLDTGNAGYASDGSASEGFGALAELRDGSDGPAEAAKISKETPIEREIRMALEREENLWKERGMRRLTSSSELVEIQTKPLLSMRSSPGPGRKGKDKGRASLYVQREIQQEAKREEDLKRQGRLLGTYDRGTQQELDERRRVFEQEEAPPQKPTPPRKADERRGGVDELEAKQPAGRGPHPTGDTRGGRSLPTTHFQASQPTGEKSRHRPSVSQHASASAGKRGSEDSQGGRLPGSTPSPSGTAVLPAECFSFSFWKPKVSFVEDMGTQGPLRGEDGREEQYRLRTWKPQTSALIEEEIRSDLQREEELQEQRRRRRLVDGYGSSGDGFSQEGSRSRHSSAASGTSGSYSVSGSPGLAPAPHQGVLGLASSFAPLRVTSPCQGSTETPDPARSSPLEERRRRVKEDGKYAGIEPVDRINTEVVESTRVTRHKSAMAQRWEAGQYIRDED